MKLKITKSKIPLTTCKLLLAIGIILFSTISWGNINNPLSANKENVTPNLESFVGIAAGTYSISPGPFYPFIATTNNSGATWNYPRSVLDNLQTTIDPSLVFGLLRGAACTGIGADSTCVALGSFCRTDDCTSQVPLVALGKNQVTDWTFPHSVFQDLTTKIDPNFARGFFINGNCVGRGDQAVCVAAGLYTNPFVQNPLVGLSTNGGETWTYPTTITQNLHQAIDPSYSGGWLESASCNTAKSNTVCIATGNFCSGDPCTIQLPLLALTTNKGNTWSYPSVIFNNLTTVIDPDFRGGELISSACTGTQTHYTVCITVGNFFKSDFNSSPLLAVSTTAGASWSYPSFIYTDLATKIGHDFSGGAFKAASCIGEGKRARCIAAGSFNTTKGTELPLVALSKNGGQTWSYPPFIYTKLKTTVDSNLRRASFTSASCFNRNKHSICMAAGSYCPDIFCSRTFPLVAVTRDGGRTWNYPPSVFQNLDVLIDPDMTRASFSDISCSGSDLSSLCVASGEYSLPSATFPLAAYSTDNGVTWTYPPYIFQNLTTTINPEFIAGVFNGAGSSGRGVNENKLKFTPVSSFRK